MSIQSHQIAIGIEWIIRNKLDCERFGFGGIADADFIDYGGAYTAFAATLSKDYSYNNKEKIDSFLLKYSHLNKTRIEDAEEEFKEALEEFDNLVKVL